MQPHERIEDEEARLQTGNGLGEVAAIGVEVEAQDRRGDHLDIEVGERHAGGSRDAFEAAAHDVQCVLGGVEQHATGVWRREPAQARNTGGYRNSQVQSQERLAALGLAPDDTNGLLGPEPRDQPAMLLGTLGETPCGLDREKAHRRCLAVFISGTGGAAQVSRNSFSSICRASRWAATESSSPAMFMRARGLPWA